MLSLSGQLKDRPTHVTFSDDDDGEDADSQAQSSELASGSKAETENEEGGGLGGGAGSAADDAAAVGQRPSKKRRLSSTEDADEQVQRWLACFHEDVCMAIRPCTMFQLSVVPPAQQLNRLEKSVITVGFALAVDIVQLTPSGGSRSLCAGV